MTKKIPALVAALAVTLCIAPGAFAGAEVDGDAIAVGVVGGDVTNLAFGFGAKATSNIGAIVEGANIKGDAIAIGVVAGNVTNAADGQDAKATSNIGVISVD